MVQYKVVIKKSPVQPYEIIMFVGVREACNYFVWSYFGGTEGLEVLEYAG